MHRRCTYRCSMRLRRGHAITSTFSCLSSLPLIISSWQKMSSVYNQTHSDDIPVGNPRYTPCQRSDAAISNHVRNIYVLRKLRTSDYSGNRQGQSNLLINRYEKSLEACMETSSHHFNAHILQHSNRWDYVRFGYHLTQYKLSDRTWYYMLWPVLA